MGVTALGVDQVRLLARSRGIALDCSEHRPRGRAGHAPLGASVRFRYAQRVAANPLGVFNKSGTLSVSQAYAVIQQSVFNIFLQILFRVNVN